jgi:hypothetical protein
MFTGTKRSKETFLILQEVLKLEKINIIAS